MQVQLYSWTPQMVNDADLAAFKLRHVVSGILNGEPVSDPRTTFHEVLELIPDLDANLRRQALVVMDICQVVIRDRKH